jgi:putative hydrolase of the HAD superfamily
VRPLELVLVDFDDTLVDTGPRFADRRRHLFNLLEAEGFHRDRVEHVHHEVVDSELLGLLGFGPFRLGPSFRDTYVRLCVFHQRTPDPAVARSAEALAEGVEAPSPPFPGALEALERLSRTVPTAVYTQSGFPEYQLKCMEAAGVLEIIPAARIRVTPEKTTEAFRRASLDFGVPPGPGVWMVGNSVRSDVNPALAAGARALWVHSGGDGWHHDRAEPLAPVPTAPTFAAAVDRLLAG